jgi:class 3 adenylate cyclase
MATKTVRLKPWITDAIDLDLPKKVARFRELLFHENYAISEFLETSATDRDSKFLVIGPKGYGKTLVLKSKRIEIHGSVAETLFIPRDALIDRPPGTPPIFSEADLKRKSDIQYWKSLWLTAICLAVLHAADPDALLEINSDFTRSLQKAKIQHTASDIFNSLLHLTDAQFFKTTTACAAWMVPLYRSVRRPVAVFLDNIDDYFYPQLPTSGAGPSTIYRNESRKIWVLAQVGLAEAVRELRDINTQVKIFAALRKEALLRAYEVTPNTQQLMGIAVDLQYTHSELQEIFTKNILLLQPHRLAEPNASDPIARFVGSQNVTVVHPYTGKRERFFDFVVRHSLGRPRDLMAMGEAISKIDPPRSVEQLREAVFKAARGSILEYLQDMKSFIPVPEIHELSRLIRRNVLSDRELKEIASEYVSLMERQKIETNGHPFCALYRMGLLGVLQQNNLGESVQQFRHPDSLPMDKNEHVLPAARSYLIHPALDDFINEVRAGDYRMNFERVNIVGDHLPWNDYRTEKYVVKGDVVGFSEIMQSPEYSKLFPLLFDEWAQEACTGLLYRGVSAGDSILMVDGSPVALIHALRRLAKKLRNFGPFPRKMRFGASSGPIDFRNKKDVAEPEGSALRTAARLEVLSAPAKVLASDGFARAALEFGFATSCLRLLKETDRPDLSYANGKFRVQKNAADPPIVTDLWEIDAET